MQGLCALSTPVSRPQAERSAKDRDISNLRQWLDQAQGQLQNTQTALNLLEQECKDLSRAVDAHSRNGRIEASAVPLAEGTLGQMEEKCTDQPCTSQQHGALHQHNRQVRQSQSDYPAGMRYCKKCNSLQGVQIQVTHMERRLDAIAGEAETSLALAATHQQKRGALALRCWMTPVDGSSSRGLHIF